ncbi:UHRF1 binding protein 1 protein [Trichuris trichiura]|uniref:UHRF1 binding protein 1 protein n=1 Tax=Trichuris trichiura TaxID=36087 RepID=A0A077Z3Y5_TRITR|nr:UHRF1 binding protein 1 protein [Trichuris trichiura]
MGPLKSWHLDGYAMLYKIFAKNITADQISVELLRGKGELYNIELNENVLAEMLEMPSWMRIGRAFIDEIRVELILSTELRDFPTTGFPTVSSYSIDSYGFAHRVVEGMSLRINAIEVFFASKKFGGSLMLSQICVDSRTPFWKEASSLRETRISDVTLQQVLLFKQISWKTFRLEASTLEDSVVTGYNINAPFRLITSQGKFHGTVYGGRLALIMDNLLWVASLSQLQSAISFGQFIADLIESSKKCSAELPAESSQKRKPWSFLSQLSEHKMKQDAPLNSAFHHFNVIETSFHCYVGQIDLHVCDETEAEAFHAGWDIINGAIQITISKLVCDFYPYHLAVGSRKHWVFYSETKFADKVQYLLNNYQSLYEKRTKNYDKLMSSVGVFRIYDIVVFCVTDQSSGKHHARKLVCADREALKLPLDLPIIHAEINDFYNLEQTDIPLPPSSRFVQVHPVRVHWHHRTFRWINYVLCQINSSLFAHSTTTDALTNALHADVFIELTMPWIQLPLDSMRHSEYGGRMPMAIVIRATRVTLTNCIYAQSVDREGLIDFTADLEKSVSTERSYIFDKSKSSLPSETEAYKLYAESVTDAFRDEEEAEGKEYRRLGIDYKASLDVWRIDLSPIWVDFVGDSSYYPEPYPLLCDLDVAVWIVQDAQRTLYCLAKTNNKVKLAMDHYEYLFLSYFGEETSNLVNTIYEDFLRFAPSTDERSCAVHFWAPTVEAYLLLPTCASPTAYELQATAQLFSAVISSDNLYAH